MMRDMFDRSILAALLCGSLSHDTVWAKSDIDLVLVTVDDKKVEAGDIALYADGVNVHALLVPRREFRKTVEGSFQHSFLHSFLARGRLLYTHDETIAALCADLQSIGSGATALDSDAPGVIVIGEVVGVGAALARSLGWPGRVEPRAAQARRAVGPIIDVQEATWQR